MITTQKDIAKRIGVTHATVSRSLKGDPLIPLCTRNKVLSTAKTMGYRANLLARGLKGMGTKSVGIIWSLVGPHEVTIVPHEIAAQMRVYDNYSTTVAERIPTQSEITVHEINKKPFGAWTFEFENTVKNLEDFLSRGIDTVVVQWNSSFCPSNEIVNLTTNFSAVVFVTTKQIDGLGFDQVVQERCLAISDVVSHFVKTGRHKPMMAIRTGYYNVKKIQAFLEELKRHKCYCDFSSNIIEVESAVDNSLISECLTALNARFANFSLDFDALLCGNDEYAITAIKWLEEKGYKVPEDVAVVGFNNIQLSSLFQVASIERNDSRVAKKVTDLLIRRLENRNADFLTEVVPMEFVCRSTAG